uniref:Uncharacterized protein n=1 Tax=Cacopsylla melanoneura TaxID=428564 RepID=A0A8D8W919_9HEMI
MPHCVHVCFFFNNTHILLTAARRCQHQCLGEFYRKLNNYHNFFLSKGSHFCRICANTDVDDNKICVSYTLFHAIMDSIVAILHLLPFKQAKFTSCVLNLTIVSTRLMGDSYCDARTKRAFFSTYETGTVTFFSTNKTATVTCERSEHSSIPMRQLL